MIRIPLEELEADVVANIIEEFVTRDGTDYSNSKEKCDKVLELLKSGKLQIVFDSESESCNIVSSDLLEEDDEGRA